MASCSGEETPMGGSWVFMVFPLVTLAIKALEADETKKSGNRKSVKKGYLFWLPGFA